jgi:hypothetical protein
MKSLDCSLVSKQGIRSIPQGDFTRPIASVGSGIGGYEGFRGLGKVSYGRGESFPFFPPNEDFLRFADVYRASPKIRQPAYPSPLAFPAIAAATALMALMQKIPIFTHPVYITELLPSVP